MVSKINSLKPAAENKLMDYEQKEFSRNTVNVVHSFVLNDYGNACLNYFLRFGDREKLEDAIASYINATDIDPQNKVAFYNLHHAYREKYFQSLNEEDHEKGMTFIQQAKKFAPTWHIPVIALAQSRLVQGQKESSKRIEEAIQEIDRALELERVTGPEEAGRSILSRGSLRPGMGIPPRRISPPLQLQRKF